LIAGGEAALLGALSVWRGMSAKALVVGLCRVSDAWSGARGVSQPRVVERAGMAIRVKSRGGESVEGLMRRFKKLCEKEGLTKDIKRKEFYEKPSERRRRDARKSQVRRIKDDLIASGVLPAKREKPDRA